MKFLLPLTALMLVACSSGTTETAKKEDKKAPQPLTGRQGIQATFPTARAWAADCEPLRVRSIQLSEVPAADGKAGAWEVVYVSPSKQSARTFTWSAVEAQGLYEGVYGGQPQSWRAGGADTPITIGDLVSDTPEILKTAVDNAENYLKTPGDKPQINFVLEHTRRYPKPAWRVMWGNAAGSAQYSVFIDATSGKVLGKG